MIIIRIIIIMIIIIMIIIIIVVTPFIGIIIKVVAVLFFATYVLRNVNDFKIVG